MPSKQGSMAVSIKPLEGRHAGKYHVELDWRPSETGYFTREELVRTGLAMIDATVRDQGTRESMIHVAIKLLHVVDPTGFGEVGSGDTRQYVYRVRGEYKA